MIIGKYFHHIKTRGTRAQVHLLKLAALLLVVVFIGLLFSPDGPHYLALVFGSMVFLWPFHLGCKTMMQKLTNSLEGCGDAYKTKVLLITMNTFNFVMGLLFLFVVSSRSFDIKAAFFVLTLVILATTIFSLSVAEKISQSQLVYHPVTTILAICIELFIVVVANVIKVITIQKEAFLKDEGGYFAILLLLHMFCFFWNIDDLLAIFLREWILGRLVIEERRDSIELEETVQGPCEPLDVVSLQERFQAYQRPITLLPASKLFLFHFLSEYQLSFQAIAMTKYFLFSKKLQLVHFWIPMIMLVYGGIVQLVRDATLTFVAYTYIGLIVCIPFIIGACILHNFIDKKMIGSSRNYLASYGLKVWTGLATAIGAVFVMMGYLGILPYDHTYFEISILYLLACLNDCFLLDQVGFMRLDYKNRWKEFAIVIETHIILFLLGFIIVDSWFPENFNGVILHFAFLIGFGHYSIDFWMASVLNSNGTYEEFVDIQIGVIEMGRANEQSYGSTEEGNDNWV